MKTIISSILLIMLPLAVFSQILDSSPELPKEKDEDQIQTLFGGEKAKNKSNGGYFDLYFNYTQIHKESALEVGTRMSFIMKHTFAIGIEGAGYVSDVFTITKNNIENDYLIAGGYGGITLEPIILPKFPVHISFPVLLGGGFSVLSDYSDYNDTQDTYYADETQGFLLVRPSAEIELNITKFFRLSLNASYRIVSDLDFGDSQRTIDESDIEGLSFGLGFKFGKF